MSHRPAFRQITVLASLLFSAAAFSHAEHDRARFVSPTGKDAGRCDSPVRACQTISYAVQQASKGDRVLVAEGRYAIQDADDLFYLTSKLVPVLGGYNKFDHFLDQAPGINSTILTGVPEAYIGQLQLQGFVVVNDGFSQRFADSAALEHTQQQLQQSQGPTPCVDGKAGIYPCKNIDLVSHVALADISLKPGAANDIWGHTDLNTGTEYAIIGLNNGTAVFSLADPAAPKEIGAIAGSRTSWRDIKVLQFYDNSLARWRAYAYVSSEGSDNIQILDLNQLPGSVRLIAADKAVTSAHNVYISHVDYTTNTALDGLEPTLHIVGQEAVGGAFTTYGLKNPEALTPYFLNGSSVRADYTHDAASMVVDDNRAQQGCQRNSCTVLMDFNEQSVRLWDITTLTGAGALADLTYPNA
ncbi:MAG: choice-of-anchor B family protein, partial [Chromatiaceae bacterium]